MDWCWLLFVFVISALQSKGTNAITAPKEKRAPTTSSSSSSDVRNFRRQVDPVPALPLDWELGLREAVHQAFLREHNTEPGLRDRLLEAPMLGRQQKTGSTPFGDIALLARGQLYLTSTGEYEFMQEPYPNDCEECHLRGRCPKPHCAAQWRKNLDHHQRKLEALWTVKRIRHRDPRYGHSLEIEYTISPVTKALLSAEGEGILTRNGLFNYNLPGHIFVIKTNPKLNSAYYLNRNADRHQHISNNWYLPHVKDTHPHNGEGTAADEDPHVVDHHQIPPITHNAADHHLPSPHLHRHPHKGVVIGVGPDGYKHVLQSYPTGDFFSSYHRHVGVLPGAQGPLDDDDAVRHHYEGGPPSRGQDLGLYSSTTVDPKEYELYKKLIESLAAKTSPPHRFGLTTSGASSQIPIRTPAILVPTSVAVSPQPHTEYHQPSHFIRFPDTHHRIMPSSQVPSSTLMTAQPGTSTTGHAPLAPPAGLGQFATTNSVLAPMITSTATAILYPTIQRNEIERPIFIDPNEEKTTGGGGEREEEKKPITAVLHFFTPAETDDQGDRGDEDSRVTASMTVAGRSSVGPTPSTTPISSTTARGRNDIFATSTTSGKKKYYSGRPSPTRKTTKDDDDYELFPEQPEVPVTMTTRKAPTSFRTKSGSAKPGVLQRKDGTSIRRTQRPLSRPSPTTTTTTAVVTMATTVGKESPQPEVEKMEGATILNSLTEATDSLLVVTKPMKPVTPTPVKTFSDSDVEGDQLPPPPSRDRNVDTTKPYISVPATKPSLLPERKTITVPKPSPTSSVETSSKKPSTEHLATSEEPKKMATLYSEAASSPQPSPETPTVSEQVEGGSTKPQPTSSSTNAVTSSLLEPKKQESTTMETMEITKATTRHLDENSMRTTIGEEQQSAETSAKVEEHQPTPTAAVTRYPDLTEVISTTVATTIIENTSMSSSSSILGTTVRKMSMPEEPASLSTTPMTSYTEAITEPSTTTVSPGPSEKTTQPYIESTTPTTTTLSQTTTKLEVSSPTTKKKMKKITKKPKPNATMSAVVKPQSVDDFLVEHTNDTDKNNGPNSLIYADNNMPRKEINNDDIFGEKTPETKAVKPTVTSVKKVTQSDLELALFGSSDERRPKMIKLSSKLEHSTSQPPLRIIYENFYAPSTLPPATTPTITTNSNNNEQANNVSNRRQSDDSVTLETKISVRSDDVTPSPIAVTLTTNSDVNKPVTTDDDRNRRKSEDFDVKMMLHQNDDVIEFKPMTDQSFSTSISIEVNKKQKKSEDDNHPLLRQIKKLPSIKADMTTVMEFDGYKIYKAEMPNDSDKADTQRALDDLALSLVNHAKTIEFLNDRKLPANKYSRRRSYNMSSKLRATGRVQQLKLRNQ